MLINQYLDLFFLFFFSLQIGRYLQTVISNFPEPDARLMKKMTKKMTKKMN